jgi:hypothetical protein
LSKVLGGFLREPTIQPTEVDETLGCFILTAASSDVRRCDYITELWNKDVNNFDWVVIVMARRDFQNDEYCERIGLHADLPNNFRVFVIPDGPKTAGYTRSWCFYLATLLPNTETRVCIRDDRRWVFAAKKRRSGSLAEQPAKTVKEMLIDPEGNWRIVHNTIYSPICGMATTTNVPAVGKWSQVNQALFATVSTLRLFHERKGWYPQGPILEDYCATKMYFECGFTCSTLGPWVGKRTLGGCTSLARQGDSTGEVNFLHYSDAVLELALDMARRLKPEISADRGRRKITWTVGTDTQTFREGDSDGGGTTAVLTAFLAYYLDTAESNLGVVRSAFTNYSSVNLHSMNNEQLRTLLLTLDAASNVANARRQCLSNALAILPPTPERPERDTAPKFRSRLNAAIEEAADHMERLTAAHTLLRAHVLRAQVLRPDASLKAKPCT